MNTRPLSLVHLLFGLIFLGLAGLWSLVAAGVVHNLRADLVVPFLLIAAGGIGLVAFLATSVRGVRREPDPLPTPEHTSAQPESIAASPEVSEPSTAAVAPEGEPAPEPAAPAAVSTEPDETAPITPIQIEEKS